MILHDVSSIATGLIPRSLLRVQFIWELKYDLRSQVTSTSIAEQDMLGVLAGLAAEGRIPFVSIRAVFADIWACKHIAVTKTKTDHPVSTGRTADGVVWEVS